MTSTEERLAAVTVGKVEPLNGNIVLERYNQEWPVLYEQLASQIRDAVGPVATAIEHVGSASVPGLSAKPIIDIVLVVPNSADEVAYVPSLERIGYTLRIREPDWFEHRMLRPPAIHANVHVFSRGCSEIDRMIAFRNRLRTDKDDRELYERTKRELAARTWQHVQNYADAKSEIVAVIMGRALSED